MGARYNAYDREISRRQEHIRKLKYGIDLLIKHTGDAKHPAVVTLCNEMDKKGLSLHKLRVKEEGYFYDPA